MGSARSRAPTASPSPRGSRTGSGDRGRGQGPGAFAQPRGLHPLWEALVLKVQSGLMLASCYVDRTTARIHRHVIARAGTTQRSLFSPAALLPHDPETDLSLDQPRLPDHVALTMSTMLALTARVRIGRQSQIAAPPSRQPTTAKQRHEALSEWGRIGGRKKRSLFARRSRPDRGGHHAVRGEPMARPVFD
jgi:hypothetical protein